MLGKSDNPPRRHIRKVCFILCSQCAKGSAALNGRRHSSTSLQSVKADFAGQYTQWFRIKERDREQILLSDFIGNALIQIAKGIRAANAELKNTENNQFEVFNLRDNRGDSSKIPGVKYDVAVTTVSGQIDKVDSMLP